MLKTPHNKLPLGGPAWLRAIAEEKEEMNHALPSENPEHKALDDREVQGLRDAADRMERLEKALTVFVEAVEDCQPDETFVRIDATAEDIQEARNALS